MSFDLYAVQPKLGKSVDELMKLVMEREECEGASPDAPELLAWRQRIANVIRRIDPRLEPFTFDHALIAQDRGISIEEAKRRFRHIELNTPEGTTPVVQAIVNDEYVFLTMPYHYSGQAATRAFHHLWALVRALAGECSLVIFNPQSDEVVDPARDFTTIQTRYEHIVTKFLPRAVAHSRKWPRPWWKFW